MKVVLGFDAAAEQLPSWLRRGFKAEGETVTLDDGHVLELYSREYSAGWVVLGANRAGGAKWPDGVEPLQYVLALSPSRAATMQTMR